MKVVLTGGPCVGKSTLIRMLEARGFPVVHEMATAAINDGVDPCTDHEAFQFDVLNRQRRAEASLSSAPLLFLDRGTFDGIPYREIYGRKVPDFFATLQPGSYDVCFLLETLEWENDGVRYESADFSGEIQPYFARVYENNDIPVVRVPVMPPEARLHFILTHVARAMRKSLTALSFATSDAQVSTHRNTERQKRRCSIITSAGASKSSVLSLTQATVR